MSNIPSSAMPHAGPAPEAAADQPGEQSLTRRAGNLAREYPKTAMAAGAAVVAGVAAAAIPLVRGRGRSAGKSGGDSAKGRKKSG